MSTTPPVVTVGNADAYMRYLEPFRTQKRPTMTGGYLDHGSLSGRTEPDGTGSLPDVWTHEFHRDRPTYVVYSYRTPIGWVTRSGGFVVPDVQYSMTTSHHQAALRRAWGRTVRRTPRL